MGRDAVREHDACGVFPVPDLAALSEPAIVSDMTWFRVLTPSGTGAVAVIEVVLADATAVGVTLAAFRPVPLRPLHEVPVGRVLFGQWVDEDVVVVRTDALRWEVHCHAGIAAVQRIVAELQQANAQPGGHFGQRDTSCDRPLKSLELAQRAVADAVTEVLPHCRTLHTAALVLAQMTNGLAAVMLEVDARQRLAATATIARHLTIPWRVALIGAPNVGKSSLLNALAGRERSIVSEVAGTTRDQLEADVVIDGWMVTLVDTAGVRDVAESELEAIGMSRSLRAMESCDLILHVLDATAPDALDDVELTGVAPVIRVLNKCDLLTASAEMSADVSVSAMNGDGLDALRSCVASRLVPVQITPDTHLLLQGLACSD